ncbi:MAG TPA: universal stress protein [Streptosporangiaceae bacterium]|nr:universal stress protein [Streptosporangiaceae bacterium]
MTYNVVVGVDGSAHGDAALRWALAEAEAHDDGRVTAVFSWQLPFVGFPGAFDRAELEQSAKDFLIDRAPAAEHRSWGPCSARSACAVPQPPPARSR